MSGRLQIQAAAREPGEGRAFARLLAVSMGRPLESVWGRLGPDLAERLFEVPGSAQSGTRTWFALAGGAVVGAAIAFPASEFEARQAETRRLEAAVLPVPVRARRQLVRRWRAVRGAALGPARPDAVYLEALAVLPSRRREGVAGALFQHACGWARAAGHRALDLDVAAANLGARRFYRAQGCALAVRRGRLLKLTLDLTGAGAPPTDPC